MDAGMHAAPVPAASLRDNDRVVVTVSGRKHGSRVKSHAQGCRCSGVGTGLRQQRLWAHPVALAVATLMHLHGLQVPILSGSTTSKSRAGSPATWGPMG